MARHFSFITLAAQIFSGVAKILRTAQEPLYSVQVQKITVTIEQLKRAEETAHFLADSSINLLT